MSIFKKKKTIKAGDTVYEAGSGAPLYDPRELRVTEKTQDMVTHCMGTGFFETPEEAEEETRRRKADYRRRFRL